MNDRVQTKIEVQSDLKQDIVDYLSEYHSGRDTDLDAIEAAEHIVSKLAEPRIRAMIAEEILEAAEVLPQSKIKDFWLTYAARIAKGPQQTVGG